MIRSKRRLLIVSFLLQKSYRQILRRVANEFELVDHKLDLFDELLGTRRLSKFDGLDEGIRKLRAKDVRCLYFEHVVTECN